MPKRPRRSLLSKVVVLITIAYFGIELVVLLPFAFQYRSARLANQRALLERGARRARGSLLESRRHGIAPTTSQSRAQPMLPLGGPPVHVYVFTTTGSVLGLNPDQELTAVKPALHRAELARARRLASGLPATSSRDIYADADRQALVERITDKAGAELGLVVLSTSTDAIESDVLELSVTAFIAGLLALAFFGLASVIYLQRSLLKPLERIIRADNAGRRGQLEDAVIPASGIPDDELGIIMESRNRLLRIQQSYRESLDAKNSELSRQREALRQWAAELELLVRQKSAQLVSARASLFEQEKLAALGRLAANVAHEINTPLSSIAGYAEELSELLDEGDQLDGRPDQLRSSLQVIEDQAFRCKDILKRLLGLARSDRLRPELFALGELVSEALELVEPGARRRAVELRMRSDESAELTVQSDPNALLQIVTNLVENAIDAATAARPSRGTASEVEVALGRRGEEAWLRVTDNGFGVPQDERERIFDEFYTTKPIGRGTGLGLAICQSMLRRLGGRIQLEEPADATGATFSIHFPLRLEGSFPLIETPLPCQLPAAAPSVDVDFQLQDTGAMVAPPEAPPAHGP